MSLNPFKYAPDQIQKFLVALATAATALAAALADTTVTPAEVITIVVAFGGAYGVFAVDNGRS